MELYLGLFLDRAKDFPVLVTAKMLPDPILGFIFGHRYGGVAASLDAQEKLVGGIAGQRFGVDSNGLSFNHDIQDSFLF